MSSKQVVLEYDDGDREVVWARYDNSGITTEPVKRNGVVVAMIVDGNRIMIEGKEI